MMLSAFLNKISPIKLFGRGSNVPRCRIASLPQSISWHWRDQSPDPVAEFQSAQSFASDRLKSDSHQAELVEEHDTRLLGCFVKLFHLGRDVRCCNERGLILDAQFRHSNM